MSNYKLRATPDMDTRDCEYVNARIDALLAALSEIRGALQTLREANLIDGRSLIAKCDAAIAQATEE
jgi:hypothetical protein